MGKRQLQAMAPDDWRPAAIEPGSYFNRERLIGYQRKDGLGGTTLHPAEDGDRFEQALLVALQGLRDAFPGSIARRYHVRMPCWQGDDLPLLEDYALVETPQRLATTSVSILLVPNQPSAAAGLGFAFEEGHLPTFRARMEDSRFQGLAGNLGYFMTGALIEGLPWAHNARYPGHRLEKRPSYIGFHLDRDGATEQVNASFQGAHSAVVGVRRDGSVEILPKLEITGYEVAVRGPVTVRFDVQAINSVEPIGDVAVYTPAFRGTKEIERLIAAAEESAGQDDAWQTYSPMIPLSDGQDRVNLFVANEGNGSVPVERLRALWQGSAPLPSFGAVLSFDRGYFEGLFGSVVRFRREFGDARVQIVPKGANADLDVFDRMLGGLVPAVVDGEHPYGSASKVGEVMAGLGRFGATSPIAQCGRETRNFDPRIREPAGLLVQTAPVPGTTRAGRIGWVLLDGRHELSIGASVVDVALILRRLEAEGALGGDLLQAVVIDGGSAMKAYHVRRDGAALQLDLLNRVAAGSRNGPGSDSEGLNLYSTLHLSRP